MTAAGCAPTDLDRATGGVPLVELRSIPVPPRVRVFGKLEGLNPSGSLKDRAVRAMLAGARARGELVPGRVILESSSGNTAISVAMFSAAQGRACTIVLPADACVERVRALRAYGAEIVPSDPALGTRGAIELARKLAERDSRYLHLQQYGNPENPRAYYETLGPELRSALPEIDVLVAGLGTGGTLTGVGTFLRERDPRVRILAVEPEIGECIAGLRNLDAGFVPPVLDRNVIDERCPVAVEDALRRQNELATREGILAGISSGAVLQVALDAARTLRQGTIVCVFADSGWRDLSRLPSSPAP